MNPEPPPPSLWSRQTDEPAVDYQLFAAWLQLPVPRPARKAAAAALGCSPHHLGRLVARHRWKTRAAAFDHHRADATSRALDDLLRQETKDWLERARLFRLQEWTLHERMMTTAQAALDEFMKHPGRASLTDLTRLLDLASILGRRAAGMPVGTGKNHPPSVPHSNPEAEAALRKIYGPEE